MEEGPAPVRREVPAEEGASPAEDEGPPEKREGGQSRGTNVPLPLTALFGLGAAAVFYLVFIVPVPDNPVRRIFFDKPLIPFVTTFLTFWAAAMLVLKYRKLRVQRELFLVGEFQGDIVGTVIAGFDGYRGWVYHLAVHPRCRRRGFGRDLMGEAEARLKALGCPKLNLQVRSSNAEAIVFYERLGYSIEDRASLGKVLD